MSEHPLGEHYARAELVMLEVNRLCDEARRCDDPERMEAIRCEVSVLRNSLEEIRRDQLIALLPKPKPARQPSWWKRLLGLTVEPPHA